MSFGSAVTSSIGGRSTRHIVRGLLAGSVGVAALLSVVACSDDDEGDDGSDGGSSLSAENFQASEEGVGFNILEVETGVTDLANEVMSTTPAEGEFILVDLEIGNVGGEATSVPYSSQILVDADGTEHQTSTSFTNYLPGGMISVGQDIAPGEKTTYTLVYDVAEGTQPASLEVHANAITEGVTVEVPSDM